MRAVVVSRVPSPFGENAAAVTEPPLIVGGTESVMNFARSMFHSSGCVPS